jgi:hypothetical protein
LRRVLTFRPRSYDIRAVQSQPSCHPCDIGDMASRVPRSPTASHPLHRQQVAPQVSAHTPSSSATSALAKRTSQVFPCLRRFAVPDPDRVLLYAAEDAPATVRRRLEGIVAATGVACDKGQTEQVLDLRTIDLFGPVPARRRLLQVVLRPRPRSRDCRRCRVSVRYPLEHHHNPRGQIERQLPRATVRAVSEKTSYDMSALTRCTSQVRRLAHSAAQAWRLGRGVHQE